MYHLMLYNAFYIRFHRHTHLSNKLSYYYIIMPIIAAQRFNDINEKCNVFELWMCHSRPKRVNEPHLMYAYEL